MIWLAGDVTYDPDADTAAMPPIYDALNIFQFYVLYNSLDSRASTRFGL
jgi:hypothetical protein